MHLPRHALKAVVLILITLHLTACGTILYPERKGQVSGKIDPGIAALNGIGLLFFLVPGVIAFAVDFSNGTIYLPSSAATDQDDGLRVVKTEGPLTPDQLQAIVSAELGTEVDLSQARVTPETAPDQASIAPRLQQLVTAP
ncbi:hypothetical protein SAMN02927930_02042 [Pseudidiomarina indica]|uniref:Uncharacterized protein n=1 Tax=Pseudidiomarina indica TaxID=1159017 RepID=A0A1G6E4Q6_9GAMM|nr:hypothetical protein [Pseudidiomarina indica]SDB51915.1 hypothetical protein SAMN02927930_02042 [Pseudidiomarina indica]